MIIHGEGKDVAASFIKARKQIGATVAKDARGNFGKYATLAALTEAVTEPLAAHGCALVQEVSLDSDGATVETWIVHESGSMLQFSPLTMPLGGKRDAQAVGSAITYGRRYAIAAICGIAPDDDDGQAATDSARRPAQAAQDSGKAPRPAQHTKRTPPEPSALPDVTADEAFGSMGEQASEPWYVEARSRLQNGVAKFADAALGYHRDGAPASDKQYQFLAGLVDTIIKDATGADDGHKRVLAVLCQSEIGKDNPPSKTLASNLLDRLATHKKVDGVKVENDAYDQKIADACVTIYRVAESIATPSLFEAQPA